MSATETSLAVPSYRPSEIISMVRDSLYKQNGLAKMVSLTGVYVKSPNAALYRNCAYDTLKDENTEEEISLLMHRSFRDQLDNGNLLTVTGTIERNIGSKGYIQILLKVTRLDKVEKQVVSEKDKKLAEIRNRKAERGYRNVDAVLEEILFQGQTPKVALLFAESSITHADFQKGLEIAAGYIDFKEHRVSFSNAVALAETLRTLDKQGYDVIAIIRGGGSGIEKLDEVEVAEVLADLHTPWIYGVGHEKEKLFIRNIADKVIPIPFAVGNYFRDKVNEVMEKRNKSRAVLIEEVRLQYVKQIEEANKQNAALQTKLNSMQKSLDDFTTTNKVMMQEHSSLNSTIRRLSEELSEAKHYAKELEKQLQTKKKGCMGCLGMAVAVIGAVSAACALVAVLLP